MDLFISINPFRNLILSVEMEKVYILFCFYCFIVLYSDYMVTKLKEDGLDNVHTEAAQVLKCNIKKM